MATLYKLHKPGNYIGRIIAIGSTDGFSSSYYKKLLIGAVGEIEKKHHVGNGMISCRFYPLRQAKDNKGRKIFYMSYWFFAKVRIQRIKERI